MIIHVIISKGDFIGRKFEKVEEQFTRTFDYLVSEFRFELVMRWNKTYNPAIP